MANSHYIPRFLTEPWEYGQRRLLYFDFNAEKFREAKSKSMLATPGLYTKDLEKFLSDNIETHVGKFRKEIIEGNASFEISDWQRYRGLHLLTILQALRFSSRDSVKGKRDLEDLCKKGTAFADSLIVGHMEQNQLCVIKVTEYGRLFFPETGFFVFAANDNVCESGFSWCFGVPLHPEFFIVSCSKTIDIKSLMDLRTATNLFMGRSVGTSKNAKRVVVPKELVDANGREKLKDVLLKWRQLADEHIQIINKLRSNVLSMWEMTGIPLLPIPGNIGSVLRPSID